MEFIAQDDLNGGFQALLYAVSEGLAGIAAIDQQTFNSLQIRPTAVDSLQSAAAIGHLGRGTAIAWGNPCVSTAMWRLMPETFLPASQPFCSALSVFFTLCASSIKKPGMALRPSFSRASPTGFLRPAPERSLRPDRRRSTWRNTHTPCTSWETPGDAMLSSKRIGRAEILPGELCLFVLVTVWLTWLEAVQPCLWPSKSG